MNIEIYSLCHQEAKIIPYYMRHYNQYGNVYFYEGHSTDGSADLAKSLGATIITLDTKNEVRDDVFVDIKNHCWTASKADWVIICDMDEFIYHPDLINYLGTIKESIIIPRTFEMMSETYPVTEGQIYDEVQYGFETRSKMYLFRPQEVKSINYGVGCHDAQPEGNISINRSSKIICMHMRHLSVDHIVERNAYLASRLSEINKRMGWGWHLIMPRVAVEGYFNENKTNLQKVLSMVYPEIYPPEEL